MFAEHKNCHLKKNRSITILTKIIISTIHFACDDLYSLTWPDNATADKKNQTKRIYICLELYETEKKIFKYIEILHTLIVRSYEQLKSAILL